MIKVERFAAATLLGLAAAAAGAQAPAKGGHVVEFRKNGGGAFAVKAEKGWIMIDAGMPDSLGYLRPAMDKAGIAPRDVALIVVTHVHIDHAGGLAALKEATGARVACTSAAAALLREGASAALEPRDLLGRLLLGPTLKMKIPPVEPDVVFDGELDLGPYGVAGKVVATPGHTADSASVFLDSGTVFVGDLIRGNGAKLKLGMYWVDGEACLASLRKVVGARPQRVVMSHGGSTDAAKIAARMPALEKEIRAR